MQNGYADFAILSKALKRGWLSEEDCLDFQYYYSFDEIHFFRIMGMSNFWSTEKNIDFNSLFTDILSGISSENTEFVYIILCNKYNINVYIGTNIDYKDILKDSLLASYPYIKLDEQESETIDYMLSSMGDSGGIITGNPTNKIKSNANLPQIEKLIKGLYGQKWAYVVTAKGIKSNASELFLDETLSEMRAVAPNIKISRDRQGSGQDQRMEYTDYTAQMYLDELIKTKEKYMDAINCGLWTTQCFYFASDELVANKMGQLLKSIFSGSESTPEPIRNTRLYSMKKVSGKGFGLINDRIDYEENSNFIALKDMSHEPYSLYTYKYRNLLNSVDLSIFCQIPKEEIHGYFIDNYVKFDIAERRTFANYSIGTIVTDGAILGKNEYKIDINSLNRHALVLGITGGGKTNTSKHLLTSLLGIHRKPFLVIESAKREYWELAMLNDTKDILVFTLGSESKGSVKYRLNPFERIGETSLQTHIDYILSTFKASFELSPPMPYVLETCVYEIYTDRGWDIFSGDNKYKKTEYPTLEDLYHKVEIVVDRMGYDNKLRSDIKAALQARISSLLIGGKGAMLNTPKSFPIDKLLNSPVVLELEDIGDDDVKAFIIGILLVQLYEYRKSNDTSIKGLKHILLIEEAHRLLKNVSTTQSSDSANPRGKAVEFFCNLLAEIRSYGQGIIISDQMPTKLAPDVLKNTNLKITHRIVTKEDREAIGNAMNMTTEQIDYMSTFKTGYAAVYSEGDNRSKIVKIPYIQNHTEKSREDVINLVNTRLKTSAAEVYVKTRNETACSFCTSKCRLRLKTETLFDDGIISDAVLNNVAEFINKNKSFNKGIIDSFIKKIEKDSVKRKLLEDEKLCILNFICKKITAISEANKREAIIQYINRVLS